MRTKDKAKLIFPRALMPSEDPKGPIKQMRDYPFMTDATYENANNLALRAERQGLGGGWELVQGVYDWRLQRKHGREFTLELFSGQYPPRYWTIDGVLYRNRTDAPDYVHAIGYANGNNCLPPMSCKLYELYTADFRAMANILLSME